MARLGGVGSLVGGVELVDEPAVEGRASVESFLVTLFFLAGTPSGHVHLFCELRLYYNVYRHLLLAGHACSAYSSA